MGDTDAIMELFVPTLKSDGGGATVLNLWWRRGGRHPQTKRNVNSIVVTFNEAIANE